MDFGEVFKLVLRLLGVLFLAIQAQQILNHLNRMTKEPDQRKEAQPNKQTETKKNILLIIADDLGEHCG